MGNQLCVFNSVNGQNTGVNVRTGRGTNYPSVGTIIKRRNSGFTVDTSDAKDGWYRLVNPSAYGINTNRPVYVKLQQSYLKSPNINELNKTVANNANKKNNNTNYSTSNVNSLNYTQGLDNKIYEMLQKEFDLASLNNNARIMGTPFRFLSSADYRPFSGESSLGRQYIENILSEAPIGHIVPGIPSYMPGINESEQQAIDAFITARYNNQDISSDALKTIRETEGRYFEFQSAYYDYIRYVNLLCRTSAVYMGLTNNNQKVPGTNETYLQYDWGRWTNVNYYSPAKAKQGMWDKFVESVKDELFGDYKYIKCYMEPNVSSSESTSNQTGQSQIASLFDTMEGIVREVGFFSNGSKLLSGAVDLGTGAATDITELARGALDANTSAGLSKVIGSAEHVLSGSNVIFPELWQDSSTNKSYSFNVNLVSPYGDPESIFLNIIMPMMHLIALAMPRQTSANSFGSPFLVKFFAKGHMSCDLGIVSNISIEKGGSGDAWTVNGLPLEAKVSITITELYSNLMITKSSQPGLFFKNQGLIDFLAVTCGVDLTQTNFAMRLESIISTYKESLFDAPSYVYDRVIEGLRNAVEPWFKLSGW